MPKFRPTALLRHINKINVIVASNRWAPKHMCEVLVEIILLKKDDSVT